MSTRGYRKALHKDIKIQTNDPESGLIKLTMEATVLEILTVSPAMVDFGKVLLGSSNMREITVKNLGKQPVSISGVMAKPDNMIAIAPADPFSLGPGEEKRFEVTFTPGPSTGYTGGYVSLSTDLEYLPSKIIRVRSLVLDKEP